MSLDAVKSAYSGASSSGNNNHIDSILRTRPVPRRSSSFSAIEDVPALLLEDDDVEMRKAPAAKAKCVSFAEDPVAEMCTYDRKGPSNSRLTRLSISSRQQVLNHFLNQVDNGEDLLREDGEEEEDEEDADAPKKKKLIDYSAKGRSNGRRSSSAAASKNRRVKKYVTRTYSDPDMNADDSDNEDVERHNYEWEKPDWAKEFKLKTTKNGENFKKTRGPINLAKPITHINAPIIDDDDNNGTGTGTGHGGSKKLYEWEKPEWTKQASAKSKNLETMMKKTADCASGNAYLNLQKPITHINAVTDESGEKKLYEWEKPNWTRERGLSPPRSHHGGSSSSRRITMKAGGAGSSVSTSALYGKKSKSGKLFGKGPSLSPKPKAKLSLTHSERHSSEGKNKEKSDHQPSTKPKIKLKRIDFGLDD